MIWFWIVAGLLVLCTLVVLLRPLLWEAAESPDRGESVVEVFRRELASIDSELAHGRLAVDQGEAARTEVTRRMIAAADKESQDTSHIRRQRATTWRFGAVAGIAALLPAASLAVYTAVGTPAAIIGPVAGGARPHTRAELEAAADQLKARLESEPGHVEGWVLLGRTFASVGRLADAREAYQRAIALAPNEAQLHAALGEVMVVAAGGTVSPEAQGEFAKAGNDPRARFYGAQAALQRGDSQAAKSALRALLADAPADAPWRQAVAERLAQIDGEASTPPSGPNAQDVAAAQGMSPEQRQAMIRGMVERLAARLQQNPNDKEGWTRLAHAYDVLGEADKAQAARARAAAASPAPSPPAN